MAWHVRRTAAAVAVVAVIAGCQASPSATPGVPTSAPPTALPTVPPSAPPALSKIGPGEGELDIVVRPGYAESGDSDAAYDWVTPFEKDSGCKVDAFEAGTSEQMLTKVEQEGSASWDGVAASGEISGRLIADGRIQPIDESLFASWNDFWPPLQSPRTNTVGDVHYGIAEGWSADLLMWNTTRVTPAPTSWAVIYDPTSPYAGGVSAYDSPITIADAALYLSVAKPQLGITDPFELTRVQFQAAIDLLTAQRPLVGTYWGTALDQVDAFAGSDALLGAAWPNQLRVLQTSDPPVPVEAAAPAEGVTAWADSWMVLRGARHPNCMLRWIAWTISPQIQRAVAEWVGEAPANLAACPLLDTHPGPLGFKGFCDAYHARDDALAGKVHFWTTPLAECGDQRGNVCVDYAAWTQQWDQIKAAG